MTAWQLICRYIPPPTSDCHPIKVAYLSVSLNVSRWMINMYIQTGIRCQLCIDSDVTEDVTFKLKWWHSISGSLVRWHLLLSFCGVRQDKKNHTHTTLTKERTIPKVKSVTFVVIYLFIYFLVSTHPCQSWSLLIGLKPNLLLAFIVTQLKSLKTSQLLVNRAASCT